MCARWNDHVDAFFLVVRRFEREAVFILTRTRLEINGLRFLSIIFRCLTYEAAV